MGLTTLTLKVIGLYFCMYHYELGRKEEENLYHINMDKQPMENKS